MPQFLYQALHGDFYDTCYILVRVEIDLVPKYRTELKNVVVKYF